jgi:hypothetical protein
MTLDQYLAGGIPAYADAKIRALVMDAELKDALLNAQAALPPSQNRVVPAELTDGRWMIRAALLTEINGGIFAEGFSALDPQLFSQVEVVPMAEALALLPQQEETEE